MKILIDSNIWISGLISKTIRSRIQTIIADPDISIYASERLLNEIEEVANRPKIRRFLEDDIILKRFLNIIRNRVEIVLPTSEVEVCRDPKDDFLLAISKDNNLNYLVTGDKDLLVIESYESTLIVTLSQFLEKR